MSDPIKMVNPGPRFFYKYQQVNKYMLQNLAKNQLWMSKVTSFNDPFEFNYKLKNEELLNEEQQKNIADFLECGVICLAAHPELVRDPDQDDQLLFPDNMLMWSHYADNHYGICFGLRKKVIITKVHYTDSFPIVDPTNKLPVEAQLYMAMHTKQECWEYEQEYRALNLEIRNSGLNLQDSYPIERIYFGLRTPDDEKELIKNILSDRNIEFYQASLLNDNFIMKFDKV